MDIQRIVVGEIAANCYLLTLGNDLVLIDPGDEADRIARLVRQTGLPLNRIIITHHHFDHVSAVRELKGDFKAKVLMHKDEVPYTDIVPDFYLSDRNRIDLGGEKLTVIHTPGHSPGSICLIGRGLVFTGDTLFYRNYGRTDLAGGSEAEMQASLMRLRSIIQPGTVVYPGHGPEFEYDKEMILELLNI